MLQQKVSNESEPPAHETYLYLPNGLKPLMMAAAGHTHLMAWWVRQLRSQGHFMSHG